MVYIFNSKIKTNSLFKYDKFVEIGMLNIDDEPWFVVRDIAVALGYAKTRNAIATHIDSDDKKDTPIQGSLAVCKHDRHQRKCSEIPC